MEHVIDLQVTRDKRDTKPVLDERRSVIKQTTEVPTAEFKRLLRWQRVQAALLLLLLLRGLVG